MYIILNNRNHRKRSFQKGMLLKVKEISVYELINNIILVNLKADLDNNLDTTTHLFCPTLVCFLEK